MSIGALVRRAFGRHERRIVELYRRIFVDLDAFINAIRSNVANPAELLEIGCGDGLVTECLVGAFPAAAVTGVDICAKPGRLYRGDCSRARFLRSSPQELAVIERSRYQLVIVSDVLHHVPTPDWPLFLSSAGQLLADGGTLIIKDWIRESTPAFLLGYLSDRLITGDRARFLSESEMRSLVQRTFGSRAIRTEFRVAPWHCNLALVVSKLN